MDSNADNYKNDTNIELAWAIKAQEDAELHFNLITSVDPTLLKLSKHDDEIYNQFRATFPDLDVSSITEDELKSKSAKEIWREFCNKFKDVENFNYGSLLRVDPMLDYTEENSIFATYIQFLAIEITRNKEGWSKKLYDKFLVERREKKAATKQTDNVKTTVETIPAI